MALFMSADGRKTTSNMLQLAGLVNEDQRLAPT